MSQEQQIKDYLEQGNTITSLEALNKFGCLRLGARIYDIQRKDPDFKIKSDLIELPNGKHVAQYQKEQFHETLFG